MTLKATVLLTDLIDRRDVSDIVDDPSAWKNVGDQKNCDDVTSSERDENGRGDGHWWLTVVLLMPTDLIVIDGDYCWWWALEIDDGKSNCWKLKLTLLIGQNGIGVDDGVMTGDDEKLLVTVVMILWLAVVVLYGDRWR